MIKITGLRLPVKHSPADVVNAAAAFLCVKTSDISGFTLVKKSLDARKKNDIHYVYTVAFDITGSERFLRIDGVSLYDEVLYTPSVGLASAATSSRPVVIGSGPAGLFAGLILSRAGLRPVILERGRQAEKRKQDVEHFWQTGQLDTASNVQFGEGGAGTFSDGKLTTGIKDPRCVFVLRTFAENGGPAEILHSQKPHLGTDNLINIVQNIRKQILEYGGEFRFEHRLADIDTSAKQPVLLVDSPEGRYELPSAHTVLAIGHSARDTFEMLHSRGVHFEQKPFSAGFRIEHRQTMIDKSQYGGMKGLPPSDYKLSAHLPNGRGVYTFCMCPGGTVVGAASEEGHLAVNGMSLYRRDGENANSALLVGVGSADFASDHPLAGIEFQRMIEKIAYTLGGGGYRSPAQRAEDFIKCKPSTGFGDVTPSYLPGVTPTDLGQILPVELTDSLRQAINLFDRKLSGFAHPDAVLTGVESRSSSPVRILRDEMYRSNVPSLFPCGEGCGYAGGIMSAAVDGIRCAEKIIELIE